MCRNVAAFTSCSKCWPPLDCRIWKLIKTVIYVDEKVCFVQFSINEKIINNVHVVRWLLKTTETMLINEHSSMASWESWMNFLWMETQLFVYTQFPFSVYMQNKNHSYYYILMNIIAGWQKNADAGISSKITKNGSMNNESGSICAGNWLINIESGSFL